MALLLIISTYCLKSGISVIFCFNKYKDIANSIDRVRTSIHCDSCCDSKINHERFSPAFKNCKNDSLRESFNFLFPWFASRSPFRNILAPACSIDALYPWTCQCFGISHSSSLCSIVSNVVAAFYTVPTTTDLHKFNPNP